MNFCFLKSSSDKGPRMLTRSVPFLSFLILMWSCQTADLFRNSPAPQSIPDLDSAVVSGVLENGLTYYIRHNDYPEDRIEMQLLVNVGSLQETESERGYAHFLEHLAFNGTMHFPGQDLVNYLEGIGMQFGADVNAYTSFEETAYRLQLPADNPEFLEKGLLVFQDWMGGIGLDSLEVEKEKGVILEELRLRKGLAARLRDIHLPVLLKDSRYPDRLPIGLESSIRGAKSTDLQAFYHRWYQPENMAIVIVGDVDAEDLKDKIQKQFNVSAPELINYPDVFPVPRKPEFCVSVAQDPELSYGNLSLYTKHAPRQIHTTRDYRQFLAAQLSMQILNERLDVLARKPHTPFLGAAASYGSYVRPLDVFTLGTAFDPDSLRPAVRALTREALRAQRFGFTGSELKRAAADLMSSYKKAWTERTKTTSGSLLESYKNHFLTGEPEPGIEYEFNLVSRLLPRIRPADLKQALNQMLDAPDQVALVNLPENTAAVIDSTGLATLLKEVAGEDIRNEADDDTDVSFLDFKPEPGTVVKRIDYEKPGIREVILANGLHVYLHPSDYKNDQIIFSGYSPGGLSMAENANYFSASMAVNIMMESGLAGLDKSRLDKALSGMNLRVTPRIGDDFEGFSGLSDRLSLETALKLVNLYFTRSRYDSTVYPILRTHLSALLQRRENDPDAVFEDSLSSCLYDRNPRMRPLRSSDLSAIDPAAAAAFFRERFANPSDFSFYFSGNFDTDSLELLCRRYLGTLSGSGRQDVVPDTHPVMPDTVMVRTVTKGIENKGRACMVFFGDTDFSWHEVHNLNSTAQALEILLRERIREDLGGTYGIGVSLRLFPQIRPRYEFIIDFSCDPAREEELSGQVLSLIDSLRSNVRDTSVIEKVREGFLRQRETDIETNRFWTAMMQNYTVYGFGLENILNYPELSRDFTIQVFQKLIREKFNPEKYLKVYLLPDHLSGEGKEAAHD